MTAMTTGAIQKEYLLAEATIDDQDLRELANWLSDSPWLTQGPLVKEFEAGWVQRTGLPFATFVNSGSSANMLMYYAMQCSGRLRNQKVVVPAVSWSTTVAPAIQLGFEPIMCDADTDTFGLDLECLEDLLRKHDPAMVVMVHVLGVPNRMEEVMQMKDRYDFVLLEDSCAATGSEYDGSHVGNFGEASTFSFYYGHHLSTIEGGMVCTPDEEIHDLCLHLRSHGWAKDLSRDKEAALVEKHEIIPFNRVFSFYHPGFNFRSTDLNAFLGLRQLDKADEVIRRRVKNHEIYQERFDASDRFHIQHNSRARISSISFVALAESSSHRDRVAKVLESEGIETRPLGGGNMSRQPFWKERFGTTRYAMADRIHECSFLLPNHQNLCIEDVHYICDVVLDVTDRG